MAAVEGVGGVLAPDSAAAGEGVVHELPGLSIFTEVIQGRVNWPAEARVSGWSSPRSRRRRLSTSSPSSRDCGKSPSIHQIHDELGGRGEGVGVVLAKDAAAPGQRSRPVS